ncbi:MAG: DUF2938 family protein [Bdellovibrionota bacterium]
MIEPILAGLIATAVMDSGAVLGAKAGIIVKPDIRLFGRWVVRLSKGRWRVTESIVREPTVASEYQIGIAAHYSIGAGLALVGSTILPGPAGLPEVLGFFVYGVSTSIFPWLFLFPALGFGPFGRKAPREAKLFRSSLVGHVNYAWSLALVLWLLS